MTTLKPGDRVAHKDHPGRTWTVREKWGLDQFLLYAFPQGQLIAHAKNLTRVSAEVQSTAPAGTIPKGAPKPDGADAGRILDTAREATTKDRSVTHGAKERSFVQIAGAWNWYLAARKDPSAPITATDTANMMVLLKIARSVQGVPVMDHYVDMAGYAAVAGELAGVVS